MLSYFTMILTSVLFAIIAQLAKAPDGKTGSVSVLCILLSGISLLVPLATRTIGVDYENYLTTYNVITSFPPADYWRSVWMGRPEPLYALLNYFAKSVFGSFQGVNIICAVVTMAFTYLTILQWRDEINITMCVWFICAQYYLFCYGLNRMMMAVAIIGWTYKPFFDGKYLTCLFWVLLAGLLHYSALLMIPFYVAIYWMKHSFVDIAGVAPLKALLISVAVFIVICRIIPPVFSHFSWFARYAGYLSVTVNIRALGNNLLCYPVIFWLLIHLNGSSVSTSQQNLLYLAYMFTGLCAVSVVLPVHRIIFFFYPAIALINGSIPVMASERSERKRVKNVAVDLLIYYSLMILLGIVCIYRTTEVSVLWSPFLVPYRSILLLAQRCLAVVHLSL